MKFAALIQDAGADALELNMVRWSAIDASGIAIERTLRDVVQRSQAIADDPAGGQALAVFHRVRKRRPGDRPGRCRAAWCSSIGSCSRTSTSATSTVMATPSAVRQQRTLVTTPLARHPRGKVRCSLAATGGVATPGDGIKAILAGADAVQMVSAILRHGPAYFTLMIDELRRWMDALEFASLDDIRGRLSLANTEAPSA